MYRTDRSEQLSEYSKTGNANMVRTFLSPSNGANPNFRDSKPLRNAVKYNHTQVVKILVNDERVVYPIYDDPIYDAIKNRNHEIITALFEKRFKSFRDDRLMNFLRTLDYEPVYQLAFDASMNVGESRIAQEILMNYPDLITPTGRDLVEAIKTNSNYLVKSILKYKDLDISYSNNLPIRKALERNNFTIATLILYDSRRRAGGTISREVFDNWIKWLSREYELAQDAYTEIIKESEEYLTLPMITLRSIAMEQASLEVRIAMSMIEDTFEIV